VKATPEEKSRMRAYYKLNKTTMKANARKWQKEHPERRKAYLVKSKRNLRDKNVGLKSGEFERLIELEPFCALCSLPFGTDKRTRPVADHNHATGKFRGALHGTCNLGLGCFDDNPELMEKAVAYLRRTSCAS
jgi:hypothetical protein